MEKIKTEPSNPQAFPVALEETQFAEFGMSLRDYFAAKAMQGLISNTNNSLDSYDQLKSLSKDAYDIAEAMLQEKSKREKGDI